MVLPDKQRGLRYIVVPCLVWVCVRVRVSVKVHKPADDSCLASLEFRRGSKRIAYTVRHDRI